MVFFSKASLPLAGSRITSRRKSSSTNTTASLSSDATPLSTNQRHRRPPWHTLSYERSVSSFLPLDQPGPLMAKREQSVSTDELPTTFAHRPFAEPTRPNPARSVSR